MARLVQCGWETGELKQRGMPFLFGTNAALTVVAATPTPPGTSAFCLKSGAPTATNTSVIALVADRLAADATEIFVGFSFYRDNDLDSPQTTGNFVALAMLDAAGNINTILTVDWDGRLKVWVQTTGGGTFAIANWTLLGTGTLLVPLRQWCDVGLHVVAATGATGTIEVRLGDVPIVSVVGTARTCQTTASFRLIQVGYRRITGIAVIASWYAYDNYRVNDPTGAVNNAWPGSETIRLLAPTGAGDASAWTRGGVDSGANWSQVDERPPTTTDYVYATAAATTDLYATTAPTAPGPIGCVSVLGKLAGADGAGGQVALVTKTGAGQSDGATVDLTASPLWSERLLGADPADAGAWTQAKLDALQIGVTVVS